MPSATYRVARNRARYTKSWAARATSAPYNKAPWTLRRRHAFLNWGGAWSQAIQKRDFACQPPPSEPVAAHDHSSLFYPSDISSCAVREADANYAARLMASHSNRHDRLDRLGMNQARLTDGVVAEVLDRSRRAGGDTVRSQEVLCISRRGCRRCRRCRWALPRGRASIMRPMVTAPTSPASVSSHSPTPTRTCTAWLMACWMPKMSASAGGGHLLTHGGLAHPKVNYLPRAEAEQAETGQAGEGGEGAGHTPTAQDQAAVADQQQPEHSGDPAVDAVHTGHAQRAHERGADAGPGQERADDGGDTRPEHKPSASRSIRPGSRCSHSVGWFAAGRRHG